MIRRLAVAVVMLVMVVGAENVLARGGARGGGGGGRGGGGASRGGGPGGASRGGGAPGGASRGGSSASRGGGFGGGMPMGGGATGARGGAAGARGGAARALGGGAVGDFGGASGGRGAATGAYGGGASGARGSGAAAGRFGGAAAGGAIAGGAAGGIERAPVPTTSQMNQFLGLPSDGGMATSRNASAGRFSGGDNFDVQRGAVEGPRGGVAAGTAITGPNDNTVARGAAVGPNGGVAAGRGVAGAEGGRFAEGAAMGPNGGVAAGEVARGPNGAVAARGGYAYASPSARYGQAYAVRGGFTGGALYTPEWYNAHPGVWYGAGMAAGAWRAASWSSLNSWCGVEAAPVDYNYGSTVVTQDNSVYVDGQPAGTTDEYYQQAADLAQTGAQAPATDDEQWLPLGVFAMSREGTTSSNMAIQLAVNKQGVIRGNFTDTKSNQTLPVQGSIDKQAQRAAWTIGDKTADVMETGLYNLTKDEVPALLHYGSDRSEQWLLVRVKQDDQAAN